MSALRRVLPAAVAFVVVGGSVYRKHSTVGGRSWPVAGRVAGLGGGLVAWARRPLVAVTPKPGDSVRIFGRGGALGDGPLVFPSRRGRRLDLKQLRLLLARCGIACVPHGFRSSFRDWAAEETGPSARGRRGGARPCRRQQGRGGLRPLGPVRAAATAHGQLGRVPRRKTPRRRIVAALIRGCHSGELHRRASRQAAHARLPRWRYGPR